MRRVWVVLGAVCLCALSALVFRYFFRSEGRDHERIAVQGAALATRSAAPSDPVNAGTLPPRPIPFGFTLPARSTLQTALSADSAQAQFSHWVEQYFSTPNADKSIALVAEGRALAAQRRAALAGLIETNPKHALELAAPWRWRQELPAEIAALLEQRVSGRGTYSVFGALPLEGQSEFV